MKKFFLSLCLFFPMTFSAYAHVPSANFVSLAERLSGQLDRLLTPMEGREKTAFIVSVGQRLINLQNDIVGRTDQKSLDRNYLLEYLRRHIT